MATKHQGAKPKQKHQTKPASKPASGKARSLPAVNSPTAVIENLPDEAIDLQRAVILRMQQQQGNAAVLRALEESGNGIPLSTKAVHGQQPEQPAYEMPPQANLSSPPEATTIMINTGLGIQQSSDKNSSPVKQMRESGAAAHLTGKSQIVNGSTTAEKGPFTQHSAPESKVQRATLTDKLLGGVANRLLQQAAAMVGMISDDAFGPLTSLAKAGLHGFLKRLAAVSPTKLMKMARKVFAALKSPQYLLGYLIGLLKGFFVDGLAGIFILLYDLGKLAVKFQSFGFEIAKRLGSMEVKSLSSQISGIGQWLSENAPGLATALLQELGGKGGLSGSVAVIAGYLLGKAKGAASSFGGKIAGGLIKFFSKSKGVIGRTLGEIAGRLSGAVLFEIILAVVTSGGGSAITAVKTGARGLLAMLGKVGRGVMAVIGPLGTWIGRAMKALKGWVLALGRSPRLKGLSTKLGQLLEKLGGFVKLLAGKLKRPKKAGAGTTAGGTRPKVPSEGLPAPASLPKGAKTTTEGLPAPASLPRGAKTGPAAPPKVPSEGLPAPASLPKGAKTTTEGLPAPASLPRGAKTGPAAPPKVPSEGLPAPASLPKGAKTTTEGLPAPASLPRGAKTGPAAPPKVSSEGLPAPASLPKGAKTTTEGLPAPASVPRGAKTGPAAPPKVPSEGLPASGMSAREAPKITDDAMRLADSGRDDVITLYHGTDQSGLEGLGRGDISVTHSPGEHQDLSRGFYMSEDRSVAESSARLRGSQRGGGMQHVLQYDIPTKDLGVIVDVRRGGAHREAWDKFLDSSLMPGHDDLGSKRKFLSGLGVEKRGKYFEEFLKHIGMEKADTVMGPIGDAITSGAVTSIKGESTQIAIRSQKVADRLNAIMRGER